MNRPSTNPATAPTTPRDHSAAERRHGLPGASCDAQRASEDDFQTEVIKLAKFAGWRVAHFRPALTGKGWRTPMSGHPGWPDLVLLRRGQLIFAELKSATGRTSPDQVEWLAQLSMVPNVTVATWRPSDWPAVAELLTRRNP